jgi:hypothetical protein
MNPIRRLGWTSLALFALVGCDAGVSTPLTPPPGGTAGNGAGGTAGGAPSNEIKPMPVPEKAGEPKAEIKPLSEEQIAEIKKLPPDEQPIAMAQKICPVSGEPLGGDMGAPIKQKIGDKTFYICCAGCESKVKNKPDEVLATLAKLNAK